MIDYTPDHKYEEIKDNSPKYQSHRTSKHSVYVILFTIIVLILGFIYLPFWASIIMLIIGVILIVIAAIALFVSSYTPRSKNEIANTNKQVLKFDFGDDFKLLRTASHDYEEYLYLFTDESFEPLKLHLEQMKNSEDKERAIKHEYKGIKGAGFTLTTDRRDEYLCGNVESIEVDYAERTLKHTFVIY